MIFKTGCVTFNLDSHIEKLLRDNSMLDIVFREYAERDCIITTVRNGTHASWSFHYKGKALDCRANDLKKTTQQAILKVLQEMLPGYDVVLHGKGSNIHYHIEWDPK